MPDGEYVKGRIHKITEIDSFYLEYPGVYALYEGEELIYIGSSTEQTVKDRLKDHESGEEGNCTQQATAFCAERVLPPNHPEEKEEGLLELYKLRHEGLPRCNDVSP